MSFPTAFDTSLGSNFTQTSCPNYFNSVLQNNDFITCYPMSFYLKNSQSYVKTVRSGVEAVESLLAAACSVDYATCSSLMTSLGKQLLDSNNCLDDYSLENPLVTQAYNDFMNYGLIRNATCLTLQQVGQSAIVSSTKSSSSRSATKTTLRSSTLSSSTSTSTSSSTSTSTSTAVPRYCYTDALFNLNNSADAYLYLLPLGNGYPDVNNVIPSCTKCTKQIMAIFHGQSSNQNLSISSTYDYAASVITTNCGSSFINGSALADSDNDSAASTSDSSSSAPRQFHLTTIQFLTLLLPFLFTILSSL